MQYQFKFFVIKTYNNTFVAVQRVHVSEILHNQIGTDQMSSVSHSPGSVVSSLQPTIMIFFTHSEGHTAALTPTMIVTVAKATASEASDVGTPVINVVLNSG